MLNIHPRIQNILTTDETIEKVFNLKGCTVYATNMRIIKIAGQSIKDIIPNHVSSAEYISKRPTGWIVIGVLLVILGVLLYKYGNPLMGTVLPDEIAPALFGIGLIVILAGALIKLEWVEINVIAVPEPIKFKGSRDDLDSLLHIIREHRNS